MLLLLPFSFPFPGAQKQAADDHVPAAPAPRAPPHPARSSSGARGVAPEDGEDPVPSGQDQQARSALHTGNSSIVCIYISIYVYRRVLATTM